MAAIIYSNPFFTLEPSRKKKAQAFYVSRMWRRIRQTILVRDRGICRYHSVSSGTAAGVIVDHYLPKRLFPHLQIEPSNLFCCCHECHYRKSQLEFKWPRIGDFAEYLAANGFPKPPIC